MGKRKDLEVWKKTFSLGVYVGVKENYLVRSVLTEDQRKRVALAIYQRMTGKFEKFQGELPWSLKTAASSFSAEDLMSNMIGFAIAVGDLKDETDARQICGAVSKKASKQVYQAAFPNGIGSQKVTDWNKPLLFDCDECDKAKTGKLPELFTKYIAEPMGSNWIVLPHLNPMELTHDYRYLKRRYLDQKSLDFDRYGRIKYE